MPETSKTSDVHRPGDAIRGGRYSIVGKLGQGGQATTFEGVDARDGRRVAVKRFEVKGAAGWKEVELAEREAKVLAHIAHPNLPVYVDSFEEGGSLYLVTEHIDGETVAHLRADGALDERDVLRFLADASSALDYLHGRTPPLVHRDIKPSNVIRRPDGSFAIIDFGAVRDRLKVTGSTVVGTFGYMAPEQFQGRAMPASDVYAVGATAVAMLTGKEPEDLPHKGLGIDVQAALGPRARPALVRALAAMVEPDPDVRPARLAPLLAGLRASSAEGPSARRERIPMSDPRAVVGAAAEQAVAAAEASVKRVVEELGETVRRAVVDAARGPGSRREGKRAVTEALRDTRREVKRAARQARRDARRDRRSDAMDRRPRRAGPRGGPLLLVVLLAFAAAQIALALALKVVAPAVLYLLSALFLGSAPGRAMRSAAGRMSAVGSRAIGALGRARDEALGRAPTLVVEAEGVDPHAATAIDTTARPERPRVRVTSAGDDARAEEEAEAEEEEEARVDPARRRGTGRPR